MPEPTPDRDFDGCYRPCRKAGAHTMREGCEHAPTPEPRVSILRVRTMADGMTGIATESLTIPELAARIETAMRTVPVRLGPNALAMLQCGETVGLSGGEYSAMALAVAMDLAEQATEPAPAEHCIHDRGIHHRHHTTPVDGCPWCEGAGVRVDEIETGDLT